MRKNLTAEQLNSFTEKQLNTYLRNEAKRANQRLTQLRESNLNKSSNAYRWAEKKLFDENPFFTTDRNGNVKFVTSFRKLSFQAKKSLASELYGFNYQSTTSTVTGLKKSLEKAYTTFQEQYKDFKGSFQDWANWWTSDAVKEVMKKDLLSSEEIIDYMTSDVALKDFTDVLTNPKYGVYDVEKGEKIPFIQQDNPLYGNVAEALEELKKWEKP